MLECCLEEHLQKVLDSMAGIPYYLASLSILYITNHLYKVARMAFTPSQCASLAQLALQNLLSFGPASPLMMYETALGYRPAGLSLREGCRWAINQRDIFRDKPRINFVLIIGDTEYHYS